MEPNIVFITGFPGFIAARLIRKLADTDSVSKFVLLVHPSQAARAEREIQRMRDTGVRNTETAIIIGDITISSLGMDSAITIQLQKEVTHVFHLAAVYDLAVPKELAYKVNVQGTKHVSDWVRQAQNLKRYVYFSTAYVSGDRTGRIYETELVCGQGFKNHYESTKYEAEVLVQHMRKSVPTTIIRPAVVMGDSKTGETAKFDGPYFIMRFLDAFAPFPIPYVGRGDGEFNLVPVDYVVDATCFLAMDSRGADQVYHLTDPRPHRARDVYRMICETLLDKQPAFTVPSSVVYGLLSLSAFRRWVKVEKETVRYFQLQAEYDCTQAVKDLKGSGIQCPQLAEYLPMAVTYYQANRDLSDKMIQVN